MSTKELSNFLDLSLLESLKSFLTRSEHGGGHCLAHRIGGIVPLVGTPFHTLSSIIPTRGATDLSKLEVLSTFVQPHKRPAV